MGLSPSYHRTRRSFDCLTLLKWLSSANNEIDWTRDGLATLEDYDPPNNESRGALTGERGLGRFLDDPWLQDCRHAPDHFHGPRDIYATMAAETLHNVPRKLFNPSRAPLRVKSWPSYSRQFQGFTVETQTPMVGSSFCFPARREQSEGELFERQTSGSIYFELYIFVYGSPDSTGRGGSALPRPHQTKRAAEWRTFLSSLLTPLPTLAPSLVLMYLATADKGHSAAALVGPWGVNE